MKLTHKQVEYVTDTVQSVLAEVELDADTRSNKVDLKLNVLESRLLDVIYTWEQENS